jgi:FkbM family methyltransferase
MAPLSGTGNESGGKHMHVATSGSRLVQEAKRAVRSILPRPVLNWREAQYYGRYGEVELHIVEYLCRADQDSIDVGANDGCYVHFMRKYSGRVHAFEPIPWMAERIAGKFGADVVVHECALATESGTAVLRIPVLDSMSIVGCASLSSRAAANYAAHDEITVRTERLDDIYAGNAGFIKIDVEGYEEAVLEGARNTIVRCQPRMLVEIEERVAAGRVRRIAGWFAELGYRGHFVFGKRLLPVVDFNAGAMQRPEDLPDLTASLKERQRFGRYVYNFLFFPGDEPADTLARIRDRIARL